MPADEECRICGSEEFIDEGNRLQCALCATFVEPEVKKTKQKESKKRKNLSDSKTVSEGVPTLAPTNVSSQETIQGREKWTTYEAFNIIIKKQVDALVNFGANERLHEVVLQLWSYYLQLTDVAFPDVVKTSAASYSSIPRSRDYHVNNLESEVLPHKRIAVFPRKKTATAAGLNEIKLHKKKSKKKKKDDSICEGDVPLILVQIEDIKYDLEDKCDSDMEGEKLALEEKLRNVRQLFNKNEKTVHQRLTKQVEYMCMFKTVAFCYLGILIVEDCILLGDIKRWIKEGHFPYLEAANLLPTAMKLQGLDFLAFKQVGPPSSKEIRYATGRLAHLLGIKELVKPPLMYIVARFLIDLNLPAELNTFVCSFMDLEPAKMEWGKNCVKTSVTKRSPGVNMSVPNYEARAVGFIAVALKLIFGLDDCVEKEISNYAQRLSKLKGIGKKVFIWDEWVQHINLKLDFIKAYHSPCAISESHCDVIDVKNLHHFFKCSMSKWHQSSEVVKQHSYHKHKKSCSSIQQLLADLNDLKKDCTSTVWPPTSFPFTQAASQFNSKSNSENNLLGQDFRGKTLSYLTHPYLWNRFAEKKCHVPEELRTVHSEFKNVTILNFEYWFHDVKCNDLNNMCVAELPKSFQWLLLVLGHCSEVKATEIYAEVLLIEKIMLCKNGGSSQVRRLKTKHW